MRTTIERDRNFSMRMSGAEERDLEAVAKALGLTASATLRTLVRRERHRLADEKAQRGGRR
jgi:hypothetical protein